MKGDDTMTIIYRDEIGTVAITIDNPTEVMFGNGNVYFTDDDGNDYTISIENLIVIHNM